VQEHILKSLIALSRARQAEFDEADQRVYLHVLSDLYPAQVQAACVNLARRPRPEYGSAMPSAGDIREACYDVARKQREAIEEGQRHRALPEGPPVPAPAIEDFKARVRQLVSAKRFQLPRVKDAKAAAAGESE
jgi:hypothetical protein